MSTSHNRDLIALKVIGIGGAGMNIVSHMRSQGVDGAEFVVMNTDAASLKAHPCPQRVLLEDERLGKEPLGWCESESRGALVDALSGARLVVLIGGMGGDTATKVLPTCARLSEGLGVPTVCMVTLPFAFEGAGRMERARQGVDRLEGTAERVVVFQNGRLLRELPVGTTLDDAFRHVSDILLREVRRLSRLVGDAGDHDEASLRHRLRDEDPCS